jgi:outer membrane protein OmpA-like peptidoglycan-associated protein
LEDTGKKLGATEAELAATAGELQQAQADLGGARAELDDTGKKLSQAEAELAAASGELQQAKADLGGVKAELKDTAKNLGKAESELMATSGELQKALELAKDRLDVAQRIKDDFAKAGISADVNSGTGDVILDFGKDYFDTDSHKLKPGMRKTIREAIPVYAKSLFDNTSVSADISSVEIIGFASPTFGGKPVNPTELSAANRIAVNYNLDLSYERAKSIFEYAFDTRKLKFKHQDSMLPLIKVTGRSFLSEQVNPEDTGNLTPEEFCEQYNCYESQRVIIKFGLTRKENS